jgi:uncharacterized protein YbjT (DUF2867 family)
MRVFLAGATGFIGGHTVRALCERGHEITCLVRQPANRSSKSQALAGLPGIRLVMGEWTNPASWQLYLSGHDAAINTVGIIRERPDATFRKIHTESPIALFEAAAGAGARKIVQLSALGADDHAVSRFHLSKRDADRRLAGMGIPFVVLRPSFVYGPGDHSMSFFKRLARLPVTPVPGDGKYRVQPVHISDVVEAICQALERPDLDALTVDMAGAQVVTFNTLLDILARLRGRARGARKLHIPWPIMQWAAFITDALGGRGPITSDELLMLRRGSVADNRVFVRYFGFEPIAIEKGLARDAERRPQP